MRVWGSNEGRVWMSLGGVGHVELTKGFFGLTHVQHDIHIPISLEPNYSSHLVENKADLLPSTITAETCEQLVEPNFQLIDFQSRLR